MPNYDPACGRFIRLSLSTFVIGTNSIGGLNLENNISYESKSKQIPRYQNCICSVKSDICKSLIELGFYGIQVNVSPKVIPQMTMSLEE